MQNHLFHHTQTFYLESGEHLHGFTLHYCTFGKPKADFSNVVWVCHALTGNAEVTDWWQGLFGEGAMFNPEEHFVICANMLGSCYGSTGPLSENPATGKPYYHAFPQLTIRDMVHALDLLRQHLQIPKVHLLIGGSMGGQQALEWAIQQPDVFDHLVLTATNARHSPWGIAFNETQRMAIANDPTWKESQPAAGLNGLKTARAIAMLSYRHYRTYERSQTDASDARLSGYLATTYQRYQGEKLANRFNAFSYWTLSAAMDTQSVGRNRPSAKAALQLVKARTLVVGIDTDILFPPSEQKFIAKHISKAEYTEIHSEYGHDGFLVETSALAKKIALFLAFQQKEALVETL